MKQNSFILAAGVSLAMALTFSCSSDGSDGKDGAQGLQGEAGAGCIVSSVDEGTKITCGASTVVIPSGTDGSQGPKGDTGEDGINGEGCSMRSVTEGIEITCGSQVDTLKNGSQGVQGNDGKEGESCEVEQGSDGFITITCGESKVGIAFCGKDEYNLYNPVTQTCKGGFVKYNDEDLLKDTRDGKTYRYAEIGDYTWMAENLTYGTEDGKYTWEEALEACPDGWELPEYSVIEELISTEDASTLLNLTTSSYWWSATNYDSADAYAMRSNAGNILSIPVVDKIIPYFIRCVKAN